LRLLLQCLDDDGTAAHRVCFFHNLVVYQSQLVYLYQGVPHAACHCFLTCPLCAFKHLCQHMKCLMQSYIWHDRPSAARDPRHPSHLAHGPAPGHCHHECIAKVSQVCGHEGGSGTRHITLLSACKAAWHAAAPLSLLHLGWHEQLQPVTELAQTQTPSALILGSSRCLRCNRSGINQQYGWQFCQHWQNCCAYI